LKNPFSNAHDYPFNHVKGKKKLLSTMRVVNVHMIAPWGQNAEFINIPLHGADGRQRRLTL
jgi:hypothetical protein